MLADKVRMTGQNAPWFSNPTLKINFENGWVDQVTGLAWLPEYENVTLSSAGMAKYGNSAAQMTSVSDSGLRYPTDFADLHVSEKDFTIACWLQVQNTIPTSALSIMGVSNEFLVQAGSTGFYLNIYISASPWLYTTPEIPLPSYNNYHYIKAGRIGDKIFLNINGNQVTKTIPANTVIQTVPGTMMIGRIYNSISRWIDSFIFVKGIGDDSLEVPTKAF